MSIYVTLGDFISRFVHFPLICAVSSFVLAAAKSCRHCAARATAPLFAMALNDE